MKKKDEKKKEEKKEKKKFGFKLGRNGKYGKK